MKSEVKGVFYHKEKKLWVARTSDRITLCMVKDKRKAEKTKIDYDHIMNGKDKYTSVFQPEW